MDNTTKNLGIRVALASAVGAGVGYMLYRMYSKRKGSVAQGEISGERPLIAWRLADRTVLVIGGTSNAASRVEVLLEAGARVVLVSPIAEVVGELKKRIQDKEISHINRHFNFSDLQVVDMAIYCLNDTQTAKAVTEACRKMRLPVNVTDHPELCDFLLMGQDKSVTGVKSEAVIDEQAAPVEERLEAYVEDIVDEPDSVDAILNGLFDGYSAAKYVATGFSDVFFDFSYNEDIPHISHLANNTRHTRQGLNIHGQSVKVVSLDTRAGAGTALHGTLIANSAAHAFTPSNGLVEMIPTLHRLSLESRGAVVHVATQNVGDDLAITGGDVSDILPAFHTGAAIFASSTVQDVHDVGLAAHLVSQYNSKPAVHFFDGYRVAREATKIQLLSHDAIRKLSDEYNHKLENSHKSLGSSAFVDSVEVALDLVSKASGGHAHKIFEYVGDQDAESVVVVVGASALVVQDTIKALRESSQKYGKIGCLSVKLVKPWSGKHFLNALPTTAKRIAVVGPLLSDIAASFYTDAAHWNRRIPYVISVRHDKKALVPGHVHVIFEHLHAQQQPTNLVIDMHAELPELPLPSSIRGELWGSDDVLIDAISKVFARSELHANIQSGRGVYVQSADQPIKKISATRIQVGTAPLSTVDKSQPVDYVAVYDHAILSKYNTLTTLKAGGVFLLNTTATNADELEAQLPSQTKREIASRRLKFYVYDGSKIASSSLTHTLAGYFLRSAALTLLGGTENFLHLLKASRVRDYESILKAVDTLSAIQPIAISSSWLDAAEQPDLAIFPPTRLHLRDNNTSNNTNNELQLLPQHNAAFGLLFPEAHKLSHKLRPDIKNSFLVTVTVNKRLTPHDYERNVFHIEMDTTGTGLKYEIGEALGVYGHNIESEVDAFLRFYKLNPDDVISSSFKGAEPGFVHLRTVKQIFTQYLDIFGRPSKEFYQQLITYAANPEEKKLLEYLTSPEGQETFKKRVDSTVTFADVLEDFPSAHPPVEVLLEIVPPIKPRHYSIASSMKMHPNSVHLLVVLVEWDSPKKKRFGHCTNYLVGLRPGDKLTVSVKPSVMTLPPLDTQPIIMAGLGTGMAPFRAFIQERAVLKAQGIKVGPIALYFGSRSRFAEYLYGEELEAYNKEGLLTYLRLAFSRDQPQKLYIQHKIDEDAKIMWDLLSKEKGHFYLCGPTWPEADVRDAIVRAFHVEGGLEQKVAGDLLENLKEEERYILELY